MKSKKGKLLIFNFFVLFMLSVHLIMFIDSFRNHCIGTCIQNIIGIIAIGIISLLSTRKYNPFLWIFFIMVHLQLQVLVGVILTGWGLGFQYYYIGTMVYSILMSFSIETRRLTGKQIFLGLSSPLLFFTCFFISRYTTPIYDIPSDVMENVSFINYACLFIGLAILSNMYRRNATRFAFSLRSQSYKDELTKLYNRRGIRPAFDRAISNHKESNIPYAVAIIDIDDFKKINDTYGHDKGDLVLQRISRILRDTEDQNTTACRWGGEEFLIIRQNAIYKDTISELMEKVAARIAQMEFEFGGENVRITITGGCANSNDGDSLLNLIKIADKRLYIGKKTGKNKIVCED